MQGLRCRVRGAELKVQGAGCRVQGAGCRVQGVRCRVYGVERVQGAGCRVEATVSTLSWSCRTGVRTRPATHPPTPGSSPAFAGKPTDGGSREAAVGAGGWWGVKEVRRLRDTPTMEWRDAISLAPTLHLAWGFISQIVFEQLF